MTIIHLAGLIPPSYGPIKTWCGRLVPMDWDHVAIWGEDPRVPWRPCKACEKVREKRHGRAIKAT